ncbi:hypothetical protein HDU88_007332 [Geranomyces variabilis]|nr:hypothetical protein HDU88_007332 [Geranomyces variabilis]
MGNKLDDLPLLKIPQLNNVHITSEEVWFSPQDGHPYIRINLKTQGTFCRASFHDLSSGKQQDVIDGLIKRVQADELSESEVNGLNQLISYMETNKRLPPTGSRARLSSQLEQPIEVIVKRFGSLEGGLLTYLLPNQEVRPKRRVSFADSVTSSSKEFRHTQRTRRFTNCIGVSSLRYFKKNWILVIMN